MSDKKWWETAEYPGFGGHTSYGPSSWIEIPLVRAAFNGGPPVLETNLDGILTMPVRDFISRLSETLVLRPLRIENEGTGNDRYVLFSETMMVWCAIGRHGEYANLMFSTADRSLRDKALKFLAGALTKEDASLGIVYALARTPTGLQVQRIGAAGEPLVRDNYDPQVLVGYDKIVEDLKSETPSGRLAILSGPPGTGKTFIVRALMKEAPTVTFVMVPPHMVSSLADPEILPSLTSLREDIAGPILFVLEDGDSCLVARNKDNMPSIQAILNLGDGILGSVLDIRILATTNADKLDLDPALMRPGRLSAEVRVGPIGAVHANRLLKQLVGTGTSSWEMAPTLAEVYLKARELGWKPTGKKKKKSSELLPVNG